SNINKGVTDNITKSFEINQKSLEDVIKRLAEINETKEKMVSLDEQIRNLQNIFSSNQSTGKFGEWQLETFLNALFDGNAKYYQTQYTFATDNREKKKRNVEVSNVRADAVIFVDGKILCIDSKFPLSEFKVIIETKEKNTAFKTNVKNHISDISNRYIGEETLGYALMFIPSDFMLNILSTDYPEIIKYAFDKKVILVSPSTLATVIFSIKYHEDALSKRKNVEIAISIIEKVGKNFAKLNEDWESIKKASENLYKNIGSYDARQNKLFIDFDHVNKIELIERGETDANNY
ncbi:MAG: DNA recombination protein RmuC, partial [Bacillales bacterium]|nr:DNA recombination protein RmuC [Bacillales bacterium]